jgi:hypothetical protein
MSHRQDLVSTKEEVQAALATKKVVTVLLLGLSRTLQGCSAPKDIALGTEKSASVERYP